MEWVIGVRGNCEGTINKNNIDSQWNKTCSEKIKFFSLRGLGIEFLVCFLGGGWVNWQPLDSSSPPNATTIYPIRQLKLKCDNLRNKAWLLQLKEIWSFIQL